MKKYKFLLLLCVFVHSLSFGQVFNKNQVVKGNHWIYDSLIVLGKESKVTAAPVVSPATVGELQFYLNMVDMDSLSDSGKSLYDKCSEFLNTKKTAVYFDALALSLDLRANPEFYYKSNEDIDWTFYYNYKDFFLTIPVAFSFSDYIAIETDFFVGKNYPGTQKSWAFMNVPLNYGEFEFLFPRFAYGSAGYYSDKWGVNLQFGKEGLKAGDTLFGSVIYNDTFETNFYSLLSAFTPYFRYDMTISQISTERYYYQHQITGNVFKNFRFSVFEGTLVADHDFELKYLNPFMIMHSFGGWTTYGSDDGDQDFYKQADFSAYFALLFEYYPAKNARIYALFSQNEITTPTEDSDNDKSYPTSMGFQLGTDIDIPSSRGGFWNIDAEGIWTMPYLYLKQQQKCSLVAYRGDMQDGSLDPICTWIGTPVGPDCIGGQLVLGYTMPGKWKAKMGYTLTAHGENDFAVFDIKDDDGHDFYYPSVIYNNSDNEAAKNAAQDMAQKLYPSGTVEFKNQVAVEGQYVLNDHVEFNSRLIYTFVFNNNNESDVFEQGIELAFASTFKLFK